MKCNQNLVSKYLEDEAGHVTVLEARILTKIMSYSVQWDFIFLILKSVLPLRVDLSFNCYAAVL